jgi:HSP20 family molecular chaperone IbpA
MPGVGTEDVRVTLHRGVLRLEADLRTPAPKDYLLHEWEYGAYERSLDIGSDFGTPIVTSLGNGQLTVSVARRGVD